VYTSDAHGPQGAGVGGRARHAGRHHTRDVRGELVVGDGALVRGVEPLIIDANADCTVGWKTRMYQGCRLSVNQSISIISRRNV
jgi:hypothetical protein